MKIVLCEIEEKIFNKHLKQYLIVFNKYNIQNEQRIRTLIEIGVLAIGLERILNHHTEMLLPDDSETKMLIEDRRNDTSPAQAGSSRGLWLTLFNKNGILKIQEAA
jgi:transposase